MKKLFLIRHAKSSWNQPLHDKDRPLSKRGVADATLMAVKLRAYLPDSFVIFSSHATRALETAKIFAHEYHYSKDLIVIKEALYTFDVHELTQVIKSVDDRFDNILVFCHNQAVTDFVNDFGNVFVDNIVTCGFVSMEFEQENWNSIAAGKVNKIVFPKDFK